MPIKPKSDIWAQMLKNALIMGICPREFWDLSVKEWRMLNEASANNLRPMTKAELQNLIQKFD